MVIGEQPEINYMKNASQYTFLFLKEMKKVILLMAVE